MRLRLLAVLFLCLVDTTQAAIVVRKDIVTLNPRKSVRLAVLKNDSPGIAPGRVQISARPRFGSVAVNANGTITYRHTKGAPNFDSFRYKIAGTSSSAQVVVRFSSALRLPPVGTNLPLEPPAGPYAFVDASPQTFNQPVCLASPPGDTSRVFVLEKTGRIRLIPNISSAPGQVVTFLDLAGVLSGRGEALTSNGEQGLLGLAFHPQYASNGYFYVFYSVIKNGQAYERVSRFTVSSGNASQANPASEFILLNQFDEASNHNGGCLQFGQDGYLYISVGDEGGANDTYNNSQRIDKDFFSGILRIDVDNQPDNYPPNSHPSIPLDNGTARFSVPKDNPFIGRTSFNGVAITPAKLRNEFWAVGLRNPWRFSFDPVTGDLWCGDVGQNQWEEVDLITAGGNYGWAYREANHPGPKTPPAGFTSINPVVEYAHGSGPTQGDSITGGVVYRGKQMADLVGSYVYADYGSGNLWALQRTASGPSVRRLQARAGVVAFGTDPGNGDILACNISEGKILRLIQQQPGDTGLPKTLTATGIFANVSWLTPNPGFLAYEPNVPFWSDYAIKRRWFSLPSIGSTIEWNEEGAWTAPPGTVWVKHFDLETTRGVPSTKRRVETRVLVRNTSGVYGISYAWNAAQTEAYLVPETGSDLSIPVTVNGVATNQTWRVPGRAECLTCHNQQAGYTLSFNTRQLNRGPGLNQYSGNQIDLLNSAGYFSGPVPEAAALPRHYPLDDVQFNVEDRVRSYLAVNCAYCHQAGGTAPTRWDARPELSLVDTGLIHGELLDNGGDAANELVVPGDASHSAVSSRIQGINGFSRMPPLGSNQIDYQAVDLVTDWIQNYLPANP